MAANQGPMDGAPTVAVQGSNTTNVVGNYYDNRMTTCYNCITTYDGHRVTIQSTSRIAPLDRLLEHVAHGAVHDSAERGPDAPKCHPETRTAVQGDILSWIEHGEQDDAPKRILGLLAASFFFSAFAGSRNRRWKKPFIATLVYRLIQHESICGLKEEVLAVIDRDPMVFERHLDQQLEELCETSSRKSSPPSHALAQTQPSHSASSSLPARTRDSGLLLPLPDLAFNIFLDNKYNPDCDIRLFLEATFSDIRRRFNLPSTWASKDVVDLLVEQASGQFIYAATIIRFLQNPRLGSPQQLLTQVFEWRSLNDSKPFASLDLLYDRILRTSPEPLLAGKWIHFANKHVMGTLTSLVELVDENREPSFHFYHKSLLDFLRDPQRSSDLHVNGESSYRFMEDRYYRTLQERGRRSSADPPTNSLAPNFTRAFCLNLPCCIDPRRRYTSRDVDGGLANLSDQGIRIPRMFTSIHQQCKWYSCLPACGVWRKGILRHCREHGWRVLTIKETLQDRFKKLQFYGQDMFPLRCPELESAEPFPTRPEA
ncbi:hypothetical protein FA13DRAFT_1804777 [Coprinellus micaceus]|uniref:Uncharacterized protein n=1 Tax=Coprinellus micaceus TaxID=71717 RepID=A0A4Y7S414_COPMI|nr:hypothetical protein FA13DRAFT_1804777 [Coprinellus micaceus]